MGWYASEWVRCGRGRKCCPHGPYWYYYWREGGRCRKKYVGKYRTPKEVRQEAGVIDSDDDVFDRFKVSRMLCCKILGVKVSASYDEIQKAYRHMCLNCHPDKGGSTRQFQQVGAAFTWLKCRQ